MAAARYHKQLSAYRARLRGPCRKETYDIMSAGQHATGEKGGILRSFLSLLIMIAFVLGLSWALRTYVFTAYEIPSGSMEETIMTGDMVFAEKVSYYFRDPQPGDIVTFPIPRSRVARSSSAA